MNNFQYQEEVKRTLNKKLTDKEQMLNMALGLCGEAGEVADMIKKHMYQGHDLDKEELIKELGDISWYLFNMMNVLDVYSSKVFSININKLKKRYEKGFSAAESVKRVDNEIKEFKHDYEVVYSPAELSNKYHCKKCGHKFSKLDTKVINNDSFF